MTHHSLFDILKNEFVIDNVEYAPENIHSIFEDYLLQPLTLETFKILGGIVKNLYPPKTQ